MSIDLEMYERHSLSKFARPLYFEYLDDNASLNFQKYLDLWSFNPKFQQLTVEDDQTTNMKLNDMKIGQRVAKGSSFFLMTFLYYQTKGFQTTLPWYFKYPRHIFCIGAGTYILPKFLVGNFYSNYFKYFEQQQIKYEQYLEQNKEAIQEQSDNYLNLEYILKLFKSSVEKSLNKELPIYPKQDTDKSIDNQNNDNRK